MAIPRECTAALLVLPEEVSLVTSQAEKMQAAFREEYAGSDENITIQVIKEGNEDAEVLHPNQPRKGDFLPYEPSFWSEENERYH